MCYIICSYDPEWPVGNTASVRETITTLIQQVHRDIELLWLMIAAYTLHRFWQGVRDLKNTATVGQLPSKAVSLCVYIVMVVEL
jgi:hypothetical protein